MIFIFPETIKFPSNTIIFSFIDILKIFNQVLILLREVLFFMYNKEKNFVIAKNVMVKLTRMCKDDL